MRIKPRQIALLKRMEAFVLETLIHWKIMRLPRVFAQRWRGPKTAILRSCVGDALGASFLLFPCSLLVPLSASYF